MSKTLTLRLAEPVYPLIDNENRIVFILTVDARKDACR